MGRRIHHFLCGSMWLCCRVIYCRFHPHWGCQWIDAYSQLWWLNPRTGPWHGSWTGWWRYACGRPGFPATDRIRPQSPNRNIWHSGRWQCQAVHDKPIRGSSIGREMMVDIQTVCDHRVVNLGDFLRNERKHDAVNLLDWFHWFQGLQHGWVAVIIGLSLFLVFAVCQASCHSQNE